MTLCVGRKFMICHCCDLVIGQPLFTMKHIEKLMQIRSFVGYQSKIDDLFIIFPMAQENRDTEIAENSVYLFAKLCR